MKGSEVDKPGWYWIGDKGCWLSVVHVIKRYGKFRFWNGEDSGWVRVDTNSWNFVPVPNPDKETQR